MSGSAQRPRISTIVLGHRTPRFLDEAVRSATDQRPGEFDAEVILVKNFRDAAIDELCRSRRVQNLYTEAESAIGKIEVGLRAATGELLTFLDYDDLYAPGRLAWVADEFRANPRLGYLHNGLVVIGDDGRAVPARQLTYTLRRLAAQRRRYEVRDAEKPWGDPRLGGSRPDFNTGAMAVRREVLERCRPYFGRLQLMLDSMLYYAAWAAPFDLVVDPRPLTSYRIHAGNSSVVRDPADGSVQERPGFATQRSADQALTRELAVASGRPELVRDVELRQRRERLVEALRDPGAGRRAVLALLRERRAEGQPAGSALLRLQLGVYLLAGLVAPSLAREVVALSR